jgi:hypothetical protein
MNPRERITLTAKPRLTPSATANMLVLRPDEERKETERGLALIDPEQISGRLFLQIKGFPATLNVLAGNLGTGPLRLL